MRRMNLKVATCLLAAGFLLSSCFVGKYALFNKYAKWQTNMTSSKFLNAVVALIVAPIVGSICLLADTLVLNTIEFWSGNNPVHANVGTTRTVIGEDGRSYAVTTLANGYEVKATNGEVMLLIHDAQTDAWWVEQDGVKKELFRFNADGTIRASVNGSAMDFSLNEAGVYDARMAANGGHFFAMQ